MKSKKNKLPKPNNLINDLELQQKIKLEENLVEYDVSIHIFSASTTMIGVCFTVIGIIGLTNKINNVNSLSDDFILINALFFLISCFTSYISIRSKNITKKKLFEKIADLFFLTALLITLLICIFIVFENIEL